MATRGVNAQVLDRDKQRVIRLQAALVREGKFFLAGGTALGLRIGHRFSDDLDWFTPNRFDAKELLARLGHLTEKPTKTKQDGRHTVRAYYGTLETSFISYEQVPAHPEQISVGGTKIPVADIDILAAMKAAALHDRGAKRDFIDVHAIAGLSGWSVGRFIEHGARMLPLDAEQVALALTYFVDAEKQAMPRGYKIPWDDVKDSNARLASSPDATGNSGNGDLDLQCPNRQVQPLLGTHLEASENRLPDVRESLGFGSPLADATGDSWALDNQHSSFVAFESHGELHVGKDTRLRAAQDSRRSRVTWGHDRSRRTGQLG